MSAYDSKRTFIRPLGISIWCQHRKSRSSYCYRHARLKQAEAGTDAKCPERMFEGLGALREMCPAVAMDRNNRRVGKGVCCLDRIIGVHGEVERTSCSGRARVEEDHAWTKAAR